MDELAQARELNGRLHRRVQALEGQWQSRVERAERDMEHWRSAWHQEFQRLCRAHGEFKVIYEEAAKVTGAPYGRYHSVMDGCRGWGEKHDHVFANVFIPNGVYTSRVADEVKKALAGRRHPWWRRMLGR